MTGLMELIRAHADAAGDAPAVASSPGETWSYRDLVSRIDSVADYLVRVGLRPGQRMLFSIRPSPKSIAVVLGTIAAGGSIVFLDPGMGESLFRNRVSSIDPAWIAAESILYSAAAPGPLRYLTRKRGLTLPRLSEIRAHHIRSGCWLPGVPRKAVDVRKLLHTHAIARISPNRDPDTEALVVFTSGTTAEPKAVVHSERSLVAAFRALVERAELGRDSVVHTEQAMIGLPALLAGGTWSIPKHGLLSGVDERGFLRTIGDATHTFVVPARLPKVLRLIESGAATAPRDLRHLLLGGAPVNAGLLRSVRNVLPNVDVMAIYGMTEILPVATVSAADKLAFDGPGDLVGTPVTGVEVRIGDDGELHLRGPNLCTGYLGSDSMTEHASGDLGTVVNGRIVLSGRKKDMFIRGETNIYPGLYEPAISSLPGVDGCAFVAVADTVGDERVTLALVTVDATAFAEASQAVASIVDHAAMPDRIVRVDAIPTSGRSMKPDRTMLARQLERAGLL